ncbi:MAG: bile acid:sodium symporter, partial [Thermaerobacterales bacterium]
GQPALWIGLIMLLVTPCTDWYLIFTGLARGNVALGTALLPWNLGFQLLLLPLYLLIFAGRLVPIEPSILIESVLLVLAAPLLVAVLVRAVVVRSRGKAYFERRVLPVLEPFQIIMLGLAITAIFTAQGHTFLRQPLLLLQLLPPLLVFFAINFLLVRTVSRWLRINYADHACLTCVTLARNSPVALAIALSAFPGEPLIALALVIGPLIEIPVLAAVSWALLRHTGS